MKKYFVSILLIAGLIGCGSKDSGVQYKGTQEKDNQFVQAGIKALADADIKSAIQNFDKAIRQDPTNAENYLILGQVYLRLKLNSQAVDTFGAASRVAPNNGEVYYFLALSQQLDGKTEDAIKSAEKSVNLFMEQRDEERFKRSVVLLRSLAEGSEDLKPGTGVLESK